MLAVHRKTIEVIARTVARRRDNLVYAAVSMSLGADVGDLERDSSRCSFLNHVARANETRATEEISLDKSATLRNVVYHSR